MFIIKNISKEASEKSELGGGSSDKKEEIKKSKIDDRATIIKENNVEDKYNDAVQMAQSSDYQNVSHKINKDKDNYVGFWVRYVAYTIDGFIIGIIIILIFFVMGIIIAVIDSFSESIIVQIILNILPYLISFGVGLVYYVMTTNHYQATLGKMAVGVRVESENGKRLELKSLAMRETIKIVSSFFLPILHIIIAFTGKKQGLHDFAAYSVVVYVASIKRARGWVVGVVLGFQAFVIIFGILLISIVAVIAITAVNN